MNENLHIGPLGIKLIKGYEKLRLQAYKPTPNDKWTIGYGATFYEDGSLVKEGDIITEEQADKLLIFHCIKFENSVKKRIIIELKQQEFDSLVDFTFNSGGGYINAQGKNHDFDLWNNINTGMSGDELYNYWTTCAITQSGIKLNGLIRRRKSEVTLFQSSQLNFFE